MELTIEQALQQGVAAHNQGDLQEAERLYRAILESQPTHPDANHNLGVLAVSINQAEAALPLFKIALGANPKIEQFWLSYIGALIKENQIKNAKRAIKKANKKGFSGDKLNALSEKLYSETQTVNVSAENPPQQQLDGLLKHYQNGRFDEAEKLAISITQSFPTHNFSWKILAAVFKKTGRNSEAINANQTAVQLSPQDAESHSNLGAMLQDLGELEKAEASYRQAIGLKPDYAEAHNNLGVTLQGLGRLDEAEASLTQAIALKSDFAQAHYNLGITLQEQGRLEEAAASYRQAIALKSNYAEAHSNLGIVLYASGDNECAIESLEKASEIDSGIQHNELFLNVLRSRRSRSKTFTNIDPVRKHDIEVGLGSNPLIQHKLVEAELISTLYEIDSSSLDKAPGPRYGNGSCSPDYSLFNEDRFIIKKLEVDLIGIMKLAVKSEIYVYDSFFNIFGNGGGVVPHQHLNKFDKDHNLENQKYSLVYYLSVGDQNCDEPGILKLYDPEEEILPSEGTILIFPASRRHSAVYKGKTDRVMIGVNFYSL